MFILKLLKITNRYLNRLDNGEELKTVRTKTLFSIRIHIREIKFINRVVLVTVCIHE